MKHLIAPLLLVLALSFSFASAESAPAVALHMEETAGVEGSFVRCPVLSGGDAAQASVLDAINQAIRETARIDDYLLLLQTVTPGGTGLKVTCEYALGKWCVSILLSAEGKMLAGRPSQVYYPMTFDLETGERLTFDDLCDDPDAARAQIEEIVASDIAPALSTYLENTAVSPVPFDRFFLSGNNDVTFYYDNADLSFLSGRSGAVSVLYADVDGLGMCEGAPARDLVAQRDLMAEAREGRLASLPRDIAIGDSLKDVLAAYPAASDSGYYPGGAYYEPEEARLRGTYILTDEAETVVTGILCKRGETEAVVIGVTTRDDVIKSDPELVKNFNDALVESMVFSVDNRDEAERILSFLDSRGLSPSLIVATHGHLDHTAAVPELLAAFAAVTPPEAAP